MSSGYSASPSASERSNARLFVALRDRPGHARSREEDRLEIYVAQDAYGLHEQISHAFFLWLYPTLYVASSLVEPRPRIRECLTPQVCVAPRDLYRSIKNRVATVSCKIACENILKARICTAVRTGAKRYTFMFSTDCIVNSILGWRRSNKHAICSKKEWRQVNEKFM